MEYFVFIFDKILILLGLRSERSDKYFLEIVKPSFEYCKKVRKDYLGTLMTFQEMFSAGLRKQEIEDYLDKIRYRELETRKHLRVNLKIHRLKKSGYTSFEVGVKNLVDGRFSHWDFLHNEMNIFKHVMEQEETDRKETAEFIVQIATRELETLWSTIESGYIYYADKYLS